MPREDARTKGLRYLTEGRLIIRRVTDSEIDAIARGNGHVYACGWNLGGWWCECPARTRCSHLWALQTVTLANRSNDAR